MTMHKALHPRNNIDRLYVSRKEGGTGPVSIVDSVDALIRGFEEYIKSAKKDQLLRPKKTLTA